MDKIYECCEVLGIDYEVAKKQPYISFILKLNAKKKILEAQKQ